MKTNSLCFIGHLVLLVSTITVSADSPTPIDSSPLHDKAAFFQRDVLDKHWLDGLYVSIVPSAPPGTRLPHTVNQPGNVIHAGVWTGRYLAGVGYQYAVTQDSWVRRHGAEILRALRILQEVTGKPGLLARGTPSMNGWRIPRAASFFVSPNGIIASGLGGCYRSVDGENWTELKLWRENETGAADFLHAYWMGRYDGHIKSKE